jgi:hypothetical protein
MNIFKDLAGIFLKYLGFSYLYLAYTYYQLWINPLPRDTNAISTYSIAIIVEFFLIHSGVFMLAFSKSKFAFIVLFLFYGLAILAYNVIAPGNTIIYSYLFVILNRMKWMLQEPSENIKDTLTAYSAITALIYLLCFMVILWALGENGLVPHFGLTEEYLLTSGYKGISNPHVTLAFGAVYFTLLSFVEILTMFSRKKTDKTKLTSIVIRDTIIINNTLFLSDCQKTSGCQQQQSR